MPNWCSVTIHLKDIAKKDLFRHTDNGTCFDFNKIIPEPQTEEEYLKSGSYTAPVDAHLEIHEERPWFNWYDWRCDHWGTKWNATSGEVYDNDTIFFMTAWSAPTPILEALSRRFPDETMVVEIEYEGYDDLYEVHYKNGEEI